MNITEWKSMFHTKRDPIVDTWPLMQSPGHVSTMIAVYLFIVLKIGPWFMQNRKAYDLRSLLFLYNLSQILTCIWLCFIRTGLRVDYFYKSVTDGCAAPMTDTYLRDMSGAAWWYVMLKHIELIETVCFVLRKKQSQVTKMHVYHHASTALFGWIYLKYIPGEQGVIVGFLNSLVHMFMYTYYLVAGLGPEYQKYIWWKKYMTAIQIVQFLIIITYFGAIYMMDCSPPKGLTLLFGMNTANYIFLFASLYHSAYIKQNKKVT